MQTDNRNIFQRNRKPGKMSKDRKIYICKIYCSLNIFIDFLLNQRNNFAFKNNGNKKEKKNQHKKDNACILKNFFHEKLVGVLAGKVPLFFDRIQKFNPIAGEDYFCLSNKKSDHDYSILGRHLPCNVYAF